MSMQSKVNPWSNLTNWSEQTVQNRPQNDETNPIKRNLITLVTFVPYNFKSKLPKGILRNVNEINNFNVKNVTLISN